MSAFMESLWNSIFVPGPTPPLLLATNVTFGALQLILLALLLATYSIHFIVLSGLCAGLWWAINWFAAELRIAQMVEEEEKNARVASGQADLGTETDVAESGNDTELDAEVEESQGVRQGFVEEDAETTPTVGQFSPKTGSQGGAVWNTSTAARLAPQGVEESLRKRRSLGDSTDLSTDSEWERVEREK